MDIEFRTGSAPGEVAILKSAGINFGRLLLSGFVAAVVLNLVTGIANATILKGAFLNWANGMGTHLHPPAQPIQVGFWSLMGLLDAFTGVWIYAGMLPRYGAGSKTALLAGFLVWIAGRLCVAFDMFALGVFPWQFLAGQSVLGLIAILPGVLAGARIYKET